MEAFKKEMELAKYQNLLSINSKALASVSTDEEAFIEYEMPLQAMQDIVDSVPSWYKQALSDLAALDSSSATIDSIDKSQQAATVGARPEPAPHAPQTLLQARFSY